MTREQFVQSKEFKTLLNRIKGYENPTLQQIKNGTVVFIDDIDNQWTIRQSGGINRYTLGGYSPNGTEVRQSKDFDTTLDPYQSALDLINTYYNKQDIAFSNSLIRLNKHKRKSEMVVFIFTENMTRWKWYWLVKYLLKKF
jgi:hypothetical protein